MKSHGQLGGICNEFTRQEAKLGLTLRVREVRVQVETWPCTASSAVTKASLCLNIVPSALAPASRTTSLFYLNLPPSRLDIKGKFCQWHHSPPTLAPPTSLSSHFTPLLLSLTRVHLSQCLSKLSIPHSSLPDKKLIYSSQENENWNNKKNTLTPCDIFEIDPSCTSTRFIKRRPVFLHGVQPFRYVQWSTVNSLINIRCEKR